MANELYRVSVDHVFESLPEGYSLIVHPLPDWTPGEEELYGSSMRLHGIVHPILRDQYGRILDGHQRVRIATKYALTYETNVTHVASDIEAYSLAYVMNREYEIGRLCRESGVCKNWDVLVENETNAPRL